MCAAPSGHGSYNVPGIPPQVMPLTLNTVKNVLESIQGVSSAEVSQEKAQAPMQPNLNKMKEAVTDAR